MLKHVRSELEQEQGKRIGLQRLSEQNRARATIADKEVKDYDQVLKHREIERQLQVCEIYNLKHEITGLKLQYKELWGTAQAVVHRFNDMVLGVKGIMWQATKLVATGEAMGPGSLVYINGPLAGMVEAIVGSPSN